MWSIINKQNNQLEIKESVWLKNNDEEIIKNILYDDITRSDDNNLSEPFRIEPKIETEFLNINREKISEIVDKIKKTNLTFNLAQEKYIIADGVEYRFRYSSYYSSSSISLTWNTYMPKEWAKFEKYIQLLISEIEKGSKLTR